MSNTTTIKSNIATDPLRDEIIRRCQVLNTGNPLNQTSTRSPKNPIRNTSNERDDECRICQMSMSTCIETNTFISRCGHKFHNNCMSRWLDKSLKCPICLSQIPTDKQKEKYSIKTYVPLKKEFSTLSFLVYLLGGTIHRHFLPELYMKNYKSEPEVLPIKIRSTTELCIETIKFLTLQSDLRTFEIRNILKVIKTLIYLLLLSQIGLTFLFMLNSSGPLVLIWFFTSLFLDCLTLFCYLKPLTILKSFYYKGENPKNLVISAFSTLFLYTVFPLVSIRIFTTPNIVNCSYYSFLCIVSIYSIFTFYCVGLLISLLNIDNNHFESNEMKFAINTIENFYSDQTSLSSCGLVQSSIYNIFSTMIQSNNTTLDSFVLNMERNKRPLHSTTTFNVLVPEIKENVEEVKEEIKENVEEVKEEIKENVHTVVFETIVVEPEVHKQ